MNAPLAQVALLVDFDSLARAAAGGGAPDPAAVAAACLRYAGGVGRVAMARGYADWTKRAPDVARAVQAAHVVPVMALAGGGGEDRAHVRLAVDALEALYAGGEPDAFVVASGDAALLPLVQALRADGSDVLFVVPAAAPASDLRAEVDAVVTLEEVLAGALGRPSAPRPVESEDGEGGGDEPEAAAPERGPRGGYGGRPDGGRGWGRGDRGERGDRGDRGERGDRADRGDRGGYGARERWAPRPANNFDLGQYDWAGFVRLIDELEHRLPFVGVRYLVNKVLGPRNCGTDDPRQKRDLINRAVDDGILEMYEVGNVEDRRDPVTACRLDRKNAVVVTVLGSDTAAPVIPEAREGGEAGEGGDPAPAAADSDDLD